jgi:hypothetical protein
MSAAHRIPLRSDQISVEWANGNQQWMVVGGGLPSPGAWSGHDSRADALIEAHALAEELGCEFVEGAFK